MPRLQDAVLSLLTELQEQRRRCHTYRSWAMRLVLVLVLLGLVAVLVPFRAAGFGACWAGLGRVGDSQLPVVSRGRRQSFQLFGFAE